MERIRSYMSDAGILLSDEQLKQLELYYEMVVEQNKVMNLTSITEPDEFIEKHLLDSLAPLAADEGLKALLTKSGARLIDVGTGAGFPGIPLKIVCPSLSVTLLDSLRKRVDFLQNVIDTLKLKDIKAVHLRAEEGGRDPLYREQYDLVVSRAVAALSILTEYDLPFAKVGGTFIAYKAAAAEEELAQAKNAISKLGGKTDPPISLVLPDTDIQRTLIPIRKVRPTAKTYPRKPGTAKKSPL